MAQRSSALTADFTVTVSGVTNQTGDVIVTADGKPVDQVSTLQRIISGHKPGDVVDLEVIRYGEKKDFKVKLAEPPTDTKVAANDEENSPPVRQTTSTGKQNDKLGITVDAIPADSFRRAAGSRYRSGLYVMVSYAARSAASLSERHHSEGDGPSQRDIHIAEDSGVVAPLKSGDVVQFKVCASLIRRRRLTRIVTPGSITEF